MDILYCHDSATVNQVLNELPDPPTDKAIRRLLAILEEKGQVTRRKVGREYHYRPKRSKRKAGEKAFRHVLDTFFNGSLDQALAIHLGSKENSLTPDELERLKGMIASAEKREEGGES